MHSCTVFPQDPQSQLVVYTVIIAEQTLITVSENECIYRCDQRTRVKPSVTITRDIVIAQPPSYLGWVRGHLQTVFIFFNRKCQADSVKKR